jgi:hypothetical protein
MARTQVSILTLRNNETLQVTYAEGQNIKKQKQQKPGGSVMIPSLNNRLIDCVFIVDIKEVWIGFADPQTDNLLQEGEKQVVTPDSPGYKKFLKAKEDFLKKHSI